MTDPRKPINRPPQTDQDQARAIAHSVLMMATSEGAKAVGCTGASFVIMGIGIWAAELSELDQKATSQMLRSLGDLYDPSSNHAKKQNAEKKRRAAVNKLFAALDLEMAAPGGNA